MTKTPSASDFLGVGAHPHKGLGAVTELDNLKILKLQQWFIRYAVTKHKIVQPQKHLWRLQNEN